MIVPRMLLTGIAACILAGGLLSLAAVTTTRPLHASRPPPRPRRSPSRNGW